MNNEFKQLVDDLLSGVEWRQCHRNAVLNQINGAPKVKRKLSLALVIVIILILLTGVAFAIAAWHHHAEQIAQMEAQQGRFSEWDAGSRVALIRHLVEGGVLARDSRAQQLLSGDMTDEAASQLATTLVTKWCHIKGREDMVGLFSILETVWGKHPYEWSDENLVWYQEICEKNGEEIEGRIHMPDDGLMSRQEAIAIAAGAVKPLMNLPQEVWDAHTPFALYQSLVYGETDEPYWFVSFLECSHPTTLIRIPSVVIDPRTGEIYSDDAWPTPEEALQSEKEYLNEYQEEYEYGDRSHYIRLLSHEERAEVDWFFSIPDPECIPEEDALAIARKALMERESYTQEELAKLTPYAWYHGNFGSGRAAWIVRYYDESVRLPDTYCVMYVDIDADTGEIISMYPDGSL